MSTQLAAAMVHFILLVLLAALTQSSTDHNSTSSLHNYAHMERDPRFFSFFNVIRFRNNQCTGVNGLCGTCFARKECADLNGISSGTCARGWGTCCIITRTCGSSSNLNCTYFSNPEYPAVHTGSGRCTITINKCNSNICQLRLDLLDVSLGQPTVDGECLDDYLIVTGAASIVPRICGENSNQHVYVDFAGDNTPIQLTVVSGQSGFTNRKWNIRISQIECTSSERAPTGCLMYYRELQGTVMSFNYGATARPEFFWTRELADLNYGVCVRMLPGYCSIEWSQTSGDPYSFTVSSDTGVLGGLVGTPVVAMSGTQCTTDFVVIPNPSQGGTSLDTDRFCGNALVTTTTSSKPFVLTVVTNANELDNNGAPVDNNNRGFSLRYRQIPCR